MPKYFYTAKSLEGEEKSGVLDVKDESELSKNLREEGFILIRANLQGKEKKNKIKINLPFLSKVPLTEKLMFTRNLQVMVASGLALPRSLETLALQTKSKKLKSTVLNINDDIVKGKSFSDSLKSHPDVFSVLFQSMIKVGEETGNLEEVLRVLSEQMEKENELKSKIKAALIYPSVIILAMTGIGVLMLVMVVPQLAQTFEELDVELPLTTQVVIGLGNFFSENWILAFLMIIFLFFALFFSSKTKKGKKLIDGFILKIPIVSPLVKKTNAAHTIRTLSSLIAAGVSIVKSLDIVAGVLGNIYYKKALLDASEKIKKGEKLSDAMAPYDNLYPLIVIQMLRVGEETGETSNILHKLSEFFEEEIAYATKNLTAVIEPILMIIIGSAIGFFAISMVQPMYSMLGAI